MREYHCKGGEGLGGARNTCYLRNVFHACIAGGTAYCTREGVVPATEG